MKDKETGERRAIEVIKNYLSTMVFIYLGYLYYWNNPYHRDFLAATYRLTGAPDLSFTSKDAFGIVIILYAIILIPFYILHSPMKSKVRWVWSYCYQKFLRHDTISIQAREKSGSATRTLLIKFFFAPLMLKWVLDHIFVMINAGHALWSLPTIFASVTTFLSAFDQNGFWFMFDLILFADVVFFTLGYLIESPYLGNEIISAEPSLFGWLICLICYPPFNKAKDAVLGWYSVEFPHFSDPFVHLSLNGLILVLMGFYAFASVALNFKASNLTNRGIVTWGPYAVVRHPAYIAKNSAWWIGGIPFLYAAISDGNIGQLALILLGLVGTTVIYYYRAITEEAHLAKANNGYEEYKKRVRYRFIPRIL